MSKAVAKARSMCNCCETKMIFLKCLSILSCIIQAVFETSVSVYQFSKVTYSKISPLLLHFLYLSDSFIQYRLFCPFFSLHFESIVNERAVQIDANEN